MTLVECLSSYRNGNYRVVLMKNGTKIRYNDEDCFLPEFAESIDITITKYCDNNCPYCYMGCNDSGKHGDILNYRFLDSIPCGTEVAINGNDLSHPDLTEFLIYLKSRGVIVNMTVSQEHFMKRYPTIRGYYDAGLIHGLGISYREFDYSTLKRVKFFDNAVFHVVLGITELKEILRLKGFRSKILILGYKSLGRGESYIQDNLESVHNNLMDFYKNLDEIHNAFHFVSYDNLAIEQLGLEHRVNKSDWDRYFLGKDGEYSFYVDLVDNTYGVSSFDTERYDLKDVDYNTVTAFQSMRKKVLDYAG